MRPRDLSSLDVLHRSMARWNSLDVSMVMEGGNRDLCHEQWFLDSLLFICLYILTIYNNI